MLSTTLILIQVNFIIDLYFHFIILQLETNVSETIFSNKTILVDTLKQTINAPLINALSYIIVKISFLFFFDFFK